MSIRSHPSVASPRPGWTISELLVIVALITVLLAMLLPAISATRHAANSITCFGNLRAIGQALAMYLAENDGYIPGSGNTSGRHLWKNVGNQCVPADPSRSLMNLRGPIECNDYIYPLAKAMGLASPELDGIDVAARYAFYTRLRQFQCPSNLGMLSTPSSAGSTALGTLQSLSYLTAMTFLNVDYSLYPFNATAGFQGNVCLLPPPPHAGGCWSLPTGYVPNILSIGAPSEKVYLADGTKRLRYSGPAVLSSPTYVLSIDPSDTRTYYTSFSDYGAFYGDSAAYMRHGAVGALDGPPAAVDGRLYSYRHGARSAKSPPGACRLNCLFYDGHAQALDEIAAADPRLWLPARTRLNRPSNGVSGNNQSISGAKVVWHDVQARYVPGPWPVGSSWTVP